MALKTCKECGKEVSAAAKICPHCGKKYPAGGLSLPLKIFLGFVGLGILGNLVPSLNGSKVSKNVAGSKDNPVSSVPTESKETSKEVAMRTVNIKYNWNKDGLGNIMMANFRVINPTKYKIKDIEITCDHFGKSGTKIDRNVRTIYDIVPAKSERSFENFNMGFIHSQANSSSCKITNLLIMN